MALAAFMAILLIVLTSLFHYRVLLWLSSGMSRFVMTAGIRVLIIVFVALAAHLVEIGLYAFAYGLGAGVLGLGSFGGLAVVAPLDYLYFSIVSYTLLGLGDVFPSEHLRFITGVEALNGLLMIAWSGSFIYIAMGRLWPWQSCVEPARSMEGGQNKGGTS